MSNIPWSAQLQFAIVGIVLLGWFIAWLTKYLSIEEQGKRAAKRRRRDRRFARELLRSTASRDHYNEWEGARK